MPGSLQPHELPCKAPLSMEFSRSRILEWVTVGLHPPLFMELSRREQWSWLPFSPPGDLPDAGIDPMSLASPALAADSLPIVLPGKSSNRDIKYNSALR